MCWLMVYHLAEKSDANAHRVILSQAPLKRLRPASAMLAKAWLDRELESVGVGSDSVQKKTE